MRAKGFFAVLISFHAGQNPGQLLITAGNGFPIQMNNLGFLVNEGFGK